MNTPEDERPQLKSVARVSAIIARRARKAVIFRRGPSRQVLALTWDLATDEIKSGQWFKGRIYERRCDLSPDGEQLVYFAGAYRKAYRTWTAISRPPYFTALALWPKGDAWGGGGLFEEAHTLRLNHRQISEETSLAPEFVLPSGFTVSAFGSRPGWGEDEPIYTTRLERDGWRVAQEGGAEERGGSRPALSFVIDPPRIWEKPVGGGNRLRVLLSGVGERSGRWYLQSAEIAAKSGGKLIDLGRVDWADGDHTGDVLYAKDGALYRLPSYRSTVGHARAVLVADLNARSFEAVAPPDEALVWPKSARTGASLPGQRVRGSI